VKIIKPPRGDDHDILIPQYPSHTGNKFLSTTTFKTYMSGEVTDSDADPDEALNNLLKQYPGIPREIHENYIIRACRAASKFNVGVHVRPVLTQTSAMVQDEEGTTHVTLWG
jgi:hypothetical protein